jgi:hypothetical protein
MEALFSGKVQDSDELTKIIRVMKSFVLEQPVPEEENEIIMNIDVTARGGTSKR